MSDTSKEADLFSRLILASQEALENGYFEAAYHTLCACMHIAFELADKQRLEDVAQAAQAQLAWINAHAPKHKMSTESIAARGGINLYNSLLTQVKADLTILVRKGRQADIKERIEAANW